MKNLLLFSILLSTTVGAFAQLSVKPNGTTDSYVFVKNQILYVEGDVHLERNGVANNQEASIYLRDNGQLIQGGTSSNNSGDGQLSVQQNSTETNAYAYYYWCSPIGNSQTPGGAATDPGNRNFGISMLYDPNEPSLTSANKVLPTTAHNGLNTTPITVSTRWLYTHTEPGTEAQSNYDRMYGNNAAPPGFGFTMKGVGENLGLDQTYDFRGRPNNGDFVIPVQGPAYSGTGGGVPNAMMTLSGNPYPSALDLNRVFHDPGNGALSAFYFYDEDRTVMSHNYSQKPFGYGVYVPGPNDPNSTVDNGSFVNAPFFIWNVGGGAGNQQGGGNFAKAHRFSPIGQGIMFVGNTSSPQAISIKNSHRRYIKEGQANNSVFHKSTGENDNNISENKVNGTSTNAEVIYADTRIPQMRLLAIFDEAMTREMLLTFSDQSTDGYDRGMDGFSPMGMKTDAYFPVGDDGNRLPYVINSVKYELDKQIPFAFKLNKTTQIRLNIAEEVKKPYERVYLYDRQENTYRRLGKQTTYPFTLTLDAGTYDNRFFIVFRNPDTKKDTPQTEIDAENAVLANINFFQNNPSQQLEVRNPEGYTIKSANVYDMTGKLVIQEQNLGDSSKFTFYTGNLSDGVYLVKLITSEDIIVDYKTMVQNK